MNSESDKKEIKNLHSGHRERMRKRFVENGIFSLSDHEVLEMLLYNVIPQKNTNNIALELIYRLGGLEGVFRASIEDIMNAGQLTERAAVYIKFIGELKSRMMIDSKSEKCIFDTTDEVGNYCCRIFNCLGFERFVILSLNSERELISCDIVSDGNDNSVHVDIRKIVEIVTKNKALGIVLAHNHPGDTPNPSTNDISITKRVKIVMNAMGIKLLDHIICSGNLYTSLADRGLIEE